MANQIIIDIGAVANDGTGDPLRTAFNYVNNNFSNIWATGVANSNIAFSGNKILTTNTNGNLVLAPNGTGKVQANVDIVPNANNTLNLGSLTNKWNTVYTQYLEIGGTLTTGDLTVDGNLTVSGNIIQIGNLVTDAKTIQLSNTAANTSAANGSGITVGANDDIATLLYNSTGNVWTTNIGITVAGNVTGNVTGDTITANTFTSLGNTNIVSGVYTYEFKDDGNVALPGDLTVTGNITGYYILGNGSQLTGLPPTYGNANVAAYLPTYTGNLAGGNLSVSSGGNTWTIIGQRITGPGGAYWLSNPAQSTADIVSAPGSNVRIQSIDGSSILESEVSLTSTNIGFTVDNGISRSWRFNETGITEIPGDITPVTTIGGSANVGNATNQWNNAYISGNVNAGNVDLTGNITADYFFGNGSQLTGLLTSSISNGTSNVEIPTADGNVIVNVDGTYAWTFSTDGNTILPGQSGWITSTANASVYFAAMNNGIDPIATISNWDIDLGMSSSQIEVKADSVWISTDGTNVQKDWIFDNTGNLTVPGNISFPNDYVYSGNTFTSPETNGILKDFKWEFSDLSYGADTVKLRWNLLGTTFPQWYLSTDNESNIYAFDGSAATLGFLANSINSGTVTFGTAANNGAGGSNDIELTTVTGNAYVRTGSNSWQFSDTGNLTTPGNVRVTTPTGNLVFGKASATGNPGVNSTNSFTVVTDRFGTPHEWVFSTSGGFSGAGDISTSANISGGNLNTGAQVVATGNVSGANINTTGVMRMTHAVGAQGEMQFSDGVGSSFIVEVGTSAGTWAGAGSLNLITSSSPGGNIGIFVAQTERAKFTTTGANVTGTLGVTGNITGANLIATGNVVGNVNGYEIGYRNIPQLEFAGDVQVAADDSGKHYYNGTNTDYTLSIVDSGAVTYPVGMAVTIVNKGTGNIAVEAFPGVSLYLAGNATTGNRVVGSYGMATLLNVDTDVWMINGTGVS